MEHRAAVVIGINYTDFPAAVPEEAQARAGLRALRYAEADAMAMTTALETAGYSVTTLVGPAATRRAILAAIRRQGQVAGRDGLLLVHFSGHGTMDPADPDTAYLLPVDAEAEELAGTAIPLDELARHLGGVQHAVTLLDCCHSGYAVGYREGTARGDEGVDRSLGYRFQQGAQAAFRSVRGRVVLAACAGTQQAREFPRLGHGAFTYYALQCWQTDPEALDDSALFSGIDAGLQQEGLPRPVYGGVKEGRIILRDPHPGWESGTAPALTLHPAAAQRRTLLARLNALDEVALEALLYTLGVDYAASPGRNRRAKTLQLLRRLDQVGQFATLAQAVEELKERQAEEAITAQFPIRSTDTDVAPEAEGLQVRPVPEAAPPLTTPVASPLDSVDSSTPTTEETALALEEQRPSLEGGVPQMPRPAPNTALGVASRWSALLKQRNLWLVGSAGLFTLCLLALFAFTVIPPANSAPTTATARAIATTSTAYLQATRTVVALATQLAATTATATIVVAQTTALAGTTATTVAQATAGAEATQNAEATTQAPSVTPVPPPMLTPPLLFVPNFVNLSFDQAQDVAASVGLQVVIMAQEPSEKAAGTVTKQSVPPGTQLAQESQVNLTVSSSLLATMPNLINTDAELAQNFLAMLGFQVLIQQEANRDVQRGAVIRTEPNPGGVVPRGGTVTLVVSLGGN